MNSPIRTPPRWVRKFLTYVLDARTSEAVLGDLEEKFRVSVEQGAPHWKANLSYVVEGLGFIKMASRSKHVQRNSTPYGMYKSYFRIGWRSLIKNKGYSVINIGGLALGMVVVALIALWVYDEWTFDRYHKSYARIAQVVTHVSIDGETTTYGALPMPVAEELRENYKYDFNAVAALTSADRIVSYEEKAFTKRGCFSEYAFPEIASLEMSAGSLTAFKERTHVLLSKSFATAMFGSSDPINKEVRIGNADLSVVGVFKDIPHNSSFYGLNFIAPVDLLFVNKEAMSNWNSSSFQLYVLLNANSGFESTTAKIRDVLFKHTQEATKPQLDLNPMRRWHLYEFRNGENLPGRLQLVYVVGLIGVFVLALACINFVNLSTARSEKRAKEIGVRKTLGSQKMQLVNQFLCESFLVCLCALVLALTAVILLLPWFNGLSNKQIAIPFASPTLWSIVFVTVLFIALAAGSYPAFYLSDFKTVKVLKGASNSGRGSSSARRILVVIQFTISVILITGTLVTYTQIQFVKDRPTGYSREGLISMPLMTTEIANQYDALRLELLKTNAVTQVSRSSSPTTGIFSSADNLDWPGKDPSRQLLFGTICVDPYFDEVVSWRMKAGRNFSPVISSDTMSFIFNESAVRQMGMTEPVGKTVKWHGKDWNVIGVVADMVMTSPFDEIVPTVFMMDNRQRPFNYINIRLSPTRATSTSIADVQNVVRRVAPNTPFEYRFADQEYDAKFASEESVGKLVYTFTILAILISCLGLLGLASFVAEQRTKEIGIRKVLGASISQVWKLVSFEFIILVTIACAIAIPIAWYLMSNWLLQYEYRMVLSWDVFLFAAGSAIVVTMITVSYHALSAAMMNPVKSLRSE